MIIDDLDRDNFEEIFRSNYQILVSSVYSLIHRKDIAEDLVQDLFVHFWLHRNEIQINSNLAAYLKKSAFRRTINWIKREKRIDLRPEFEDSTAFEQADEASDRTTAVRKAVEQLPDKCRLVFVLNRYEGLTISEIAEHLQISKNTVENHLGKALRLLRDQFAR